MSKLQESIAQGKFTITGEIGPPKGVDLAHCWEEVDYIQDRVVAINVTDNQSSVMRYPSLGAAIAVKERTGEPVLQMTGRDRNRLALESDLLFAYSRGIRTVLCLTGDSIKVGDHKDAKGVFDLDSVQLIKMARLMESGKDLGGNDLDGAVEFCAGAIVTPEARPIEPQLIKFEKKVDAGAEFFQTQAIYDLDNFTKFMRYVRQFPVKLLAGIVLLSSARMAKYMTENIPGIAGLGEACRMASENFGKWQKHLSALGDKLWQGLADSIPFIHLTGHPERRLPGHVSFWVEHIEGESLLLHLNMNGVMASSGSACSSNLKGKDESYLAASHVLTAVGVPTDICAGSITFSLGKYNTEDEVDYVVSIMPGIVDKLLAMSPSYEDYKKGRESFHG